MKLPWISIGTGLTLLLMGCGGDGSTPRVAEVALPELPLQAPRHARQAHAVDLGGKLHLGADVAPPPDRLALVARHDGSRVYHGSARDGVGAAELIAYLEADAASLADSEEDEDGLFLRFGTMPPTVRVARGTTPELVDETVRVVQAINAALPRDWQLRVGDEAANDNPLGPPDGEIVVTFALQEDWPLEASDGEDIGLAEPRYGIVPMTDPSAPLAIEIVAGQVWVDPTQTEGQERLGVLAHEIIHLLGRGHVDRSRFPDTLMLPGGSEELTEHVLHPLDREALFAVYSRLEPGATPDRIADELGSWSDTSMHIQGAVDIPGDEIAFGAALRNGLSQPWAEGPRPDSNLADNTALPGEVRWSGRLLGLTPGAGTVAGDAGLTVEMSTLSGTLDFTGLEHWAADAAPGAEGTGTAWHERDLGYEIEVRGNTFVQTGGDAGIVTGAFLGTDHEGVGGVLVREDLSAGFGARR